jgi:hypothetical protein
MKLIVVKLTYEAIHDYPDAGNYLAFPHRHLFYITAKKLVSHNNRQIEIIQFKRDILEFLEGYNHDFQHRSCEDIAEVLLKKFDLAYCQVLEDNENGAEIWD